MTMLNHNRRWALLSLVGALLLAACDGETGTEDELAEEACEHMQEGPAEAVTATATLEGAPEVGEPHRRYDIELIAIEGGQGGSVALSAEDVEYVVFLSADVPLDFYDGSGNLLEIEGVDTSIATCEEVAVAHHVHPGVGTVELRFGPTDDTEVSAVIEGVEDGAHDHDHN